MNCPYDNTELKARINVGSTIYKCPRCNGLWMPVDRLPARPNTTMLKPNPSRHESKACPMCPETMRYWTYMGHSILCCTGCHHIWLREGVVEGVELCTEDGRREGGMSRLFDAILSRGWRLGTRFRCR